MGIDIPARCRIETTIENHDWLEEHTRGFAAANGTIICNVGGGLLELDRADGDYSPVEVAVRMGLGLSVTARNTGSGGN
jgi:hypothetical protein